MTTKTKTDQNSWPPIVEVQFGSGKTGYQVAFQVNGKRFRRSFSTVKGAEKYAAEQRTIYHNEGVAGLSVPLDDRVVAARCLEQLKPYGATLEEAVAYFIKHAGQFRNAPTLTKIAETMIAEKKKDKRTAETVINLRARFKPLLAVFGTRRPGEVSKAEAKAWASQLAGAPQSRRHIISKASMLFEYAVGEDWAASNPFSYVKRPDLSPSAPVFLTVEECAALLVKSADHKLTAFVALGLFGGLRPDELRRLDWSSVKLGQKIVRLESRFTKTGKRVNRSRIIELPDAALTWLTPIAKKSGLIIGAKSSFKKRWKRLRHAAGFGEPGTETAREKAAGIKLVKEWTNDAMRHTTATYSCAATNDYNKTAAMLGHSVEILQKHYRGLAEPEDAKRFFALCRDDETAGKIVSMTDAKPVQTEAKQEQEAINQTNASNG